MNNSNAEDNDQDNDVPEGGIRIGDVYIPPPPMPACTFDTTGPRLIITKIENHNFKSYANQTDLGPFHKNFTSIVGPNGSGKSNVIDAMLFVFGYRAQKIRSKKVGVLVHLSDQYPDLKSCTVRVHFAKIKDLGDQNYESVPGTEFVIGRTAFKDNSSYYEVNGKRVQFKNVSTLLRSHGIDLDHNRFLILQGEIEMIAMMKPRGNENDCGMLEYLEDIIGCNRFIQPIETFAKRVEELTEIRAEKLNRVKVVEKEKDDVEVARNEAIDYIKLENKIISLQNTLFQSQLKQRDTQVQNAIVERDECKEQLTLLNNEQEKLKCIRKDKDRCRAEIDEEYEKSNAVWEKNKQKFVDLEKRDIIVREDLSIMGKKLTTLEKTTETEEKKLKELQQLPEKLELEIKELEKKEENLQVKREESNKKLKEVLASTKQETEGLQNEKKEHETKLMELKEVVNEVAATMNLAQSELDMYVTLENKEKTKHKEFEDKLKQTIETIANLERSIHMAEQSIPNLENNINKLVSEKQQIAQKEALVYDQMKENRSKVEEMRASLNSSRSRNVITNFLMQKQKEGKIKGVFGRMGDLGGIDKKYDVAISTACPGLENILTDTVDTAQDCIKYLKRENKGYTTMVALEKMDRFIQHSKQRKDLSHTGYPENVPRLFDLVTVRDEQVLPALYFVMRDTLVATDIEQATRIGLNSNIRYRVVTLKGEVIDLAGTMTGGGTRKISGRMGHSAAASDVDPKDLEILERTLEEQSRAITGYRARKSTLEEELSAFQRTLATSSHGLVKHKNECLALKDHQGQLKVQIEQQKLRVKESATDPKKLKELENKLNVNKKAYDKAKGEASEVEDKVKKIHDEITLITKKKFGVVQKAVEKLNKELETVLSTINRSKTASKTAIRNQKKTESKIVSLKKETEELKVTIKKNSAEVTSLDNLAVTLVEERDAAKAILESNSKQRLAINEEIEKINEQEMKLRCSHVEQSNLLKEKEDTVKEKQDAVRKVKGNLSRLKLQKIDEEEEASLTLPVLTAEELDTVDGKNVIMEIEGHQTQMDKMKPNMAAIAEFKRKEELYNKRVQEFEEANRDRDDMKKHHDDLRKQRLDEFLTGFKIITSKLKEVYQMITLGGDAELELVDSLDPFTEGIVFSVRPPKKSWKNITNLSGGEKTLSSLALVFALHYYKPTPFYVMDEIDAALDFKNVSIVGNYIKESTKNAQFIIISLRNNMFELADRLVGIYKTFNCTKTCTIAPSELSIQGLMIPELLQFINDERDREKLNHVIGKRY